MPRRPPAVTSATMSVVLSQLSVPSASGPSVGMTKAVASTRSMVGWSPITCSLRYRRRVRRMRRSSPRTSYLENHLDSMLFHRVRLNCVKGCALRLDIERAVAAPDRNLDLAAAPLEDQIDRRSADAQRTKLEAIDGFRQHRTDDTEPAEKAVRLKPQQVDQHEEQRARGKFRQPAIIEIACRREHAGEDPLRKIVAPIAAKPRKDDRIVEGPDAARVITDRIEAAGMFRKRAHAPAGEHVGFHQPLGSEMGLVRVRYPRPERMSGVRADHADLLAVLIEREAVAPRFLHPEIAVEMAAQRVGLLRQPIRLHALPDAAIEIGDQRPGEIGIGLNLDQRHAAADEAAIGIGDGVGGVLPALIGRLPFRAIVVVDVAVAVLVAVAAHPAERALDRRLELLEKACIAGPLRVMRQRNEEEDRRIDRAVAGALRHKTEPRQFADAQLVQDLAGLLLLLLRMTRALPFREEAKRMRSQLGPIGKALQRRHEAVAAEQGDEPGDPSGDEAALLALDRQKLNVGQRPVKGCVETRIVALDRGIAFEPAPADLGLLRGRFMPRRHLFLGRFGLRPLHDLERNVELRRPLRIDVQREYQLDAMTVDPAFGRGRIGSDVEAAGELVGALIAKAQYAVLITRRLLFAARLRRRAAHGEDILEARFEDETQLEAHRLYRAVSDR